MEQLAALEPLVILVSLQSMGPSFLFQPMLSASYGYPAPRVSARKMWSGSSLI